jgi:hypothetical protein
MNALLKIIDFITISILVATVSIVFLGFMSLIFIFALHFWPFWILIAFVISAFWIDYRNRI